MHSSFPITLVIPRRASDEESALDMCGAGSLAREGSLSSRSFVKGRGFSRAENDPTFDQRAVEAQPGAPRSHGTLAR